MASTTNLLDINALAKAKGKKKAQLLLGYQNAESAALDVNDYFIAFADCITHERGLSAKDVKRKEFLTDY